MVGVGLEYMVLWQVKSTKGLSIIKTLKKPIEEDLDLYYKPKTKTASTNKLTPGYDRTRYAPLLDGSYLGMKCLIRLQLVMTTINLRTIMTLCITEKSNTISKICEQQFYVAIMLLTL